MPSNICAVMAAPNNARIKTVISRVARSPQYPDKWLLEIEIVESHSICGPNFARPGKKAQGFTFRDAWDLPVPVTVVADAEYIGGPQNGVFQLTNLRQAQ